MNMLFQKKVAKVGEGCDPETMEITSMELNEYLRFWDSPGLGDNTGKDKVHAEKLIDILYRESQIDGKPYGTIDLVLVILDGSGRDMGTTYKLLNEVIVPNFQPKRILVAINQADLAMKGHHWDEKNNCPDNVLQDFLEQKANSVQTRVKEATGISVAKPVYYSAEKGYHVEKLLDLIIDHIPRERRKVRR